MKENETSKLYNSITNVKNQFIEEAQTKTKKKKSAWFKWASMAACLAIIVAIGTHVLWQTTDSTPPVQDNKAPINAKDNAEKSTVAISADYPEYENANTLVDSSDLIFSGTVKGISYEQLDVRTKKEEGSETDEEKIPYTIFEISVEQVYKGSIDGDTIRIKRPGGQTDDTEHIVSDAPEISIGNTYLFLTETYDNSYPSLVNETHSVFNMEDAQGEGTVSNRTDPNQNITLSDIMKIIDK